MDFISGQHIIGILGGGQLGKMLLSVTRDWDIHTKVMDPSNQAPCKISCNQFVQADLMDYDAVCLLYTSPSPRDPKTSRMPSSA